MPTYVRQFHVIIFADLFLTLTKIILIKFKKEKHLRGVNVFILRLIDQLNHISFIYNH